MASQKNIIILYILRTLVAIKRFLVFVTERFMVVYRRLERVYQRTLGYRLYRFFFRFSGLWNRIRVPWGNRFVSVFGQRGILQALLFVTAVIVMLPHTSISKASTSAQSSRGTALFALVGPDDFLGEIEEVSVDVTAMTQPETRSWRDGSVTFDSTGANDGTNNNFPNEISGISAGGSAVTKPVILPGSTLPQQNDTSGISSVGSSGRTEIVYHEVQPGEVIGAIAEQYGISVLTMLWANNLTSRSLIRPGDKLKILPVTGITHKVASGDTVSKIARKYDTEESKVVAFNRLKNDGSNIVVGEELVIPDGVPPQAPRPVIVSVPQQNRAFRQVAAPPPSVAAPAGSGYIWPTSVRNITQYYGWAHTGLDIAGPAGSPLYAAQSGTVITSQCGWNGGYGCYIIVDHGGGVTTLYGHALTNGLYVSVGEKVVQGQTIGLMGSTGRSTGNHVHFEVRLGGRRTNPLQYIR